MVILMSNKREYMQLVDLVGFLEKIGINSSFDYKEGSASRLRIEFNDEIEILIEDEKVSIFYSEMYDDNMETSIRLEYAKNLLTINVEYIKLAKSENEDDEVIDSFSVEIHAKKIRVINNLLIVYMNEIEATVGGSVGGQLF